VIIFKKIRWKNLLSTGNVFFELPLNTTKTTLFLGKNGSGKSTLLDAFMFCLYGRAYRNINKAELVNSINKNDFVVEIEFDIDKHSFMVRRGMNPAIFEIYQDEQLINQSADNREYQDLLEKHILKINDKAFTQINVVGKAAFIPFMRLKANERRVVIEDLLDIQIFSAMNVHLKQKIEDNKQELNNLEHEIDLIEEKINMQQKHIESVQKSNQERVEAIQLKIDEYLNQCQMIIKNISEKERLIKVMEKQIYDEPKIKQILEKLNDLRNKLYLKIDKLEKEIRFLQTNDNCSICGQGISLTFKEQSIITKQQHIKDASQAIEVINEKYKKNEYRLEEINDQHINIDKHKRDIQLFEININKNQQLIKEAQKEQEEISNKNEGIISDNDMLELKNKLLDKHLIKEELINLKMLYDISTSLLKDGGIKTQIIKQYVPVMNQLINKYMASMDFMVNFQLDESFNESILSRFRDNFSYGAFSEGEKMRIDFALMFTWRAIAKLRNSAATNLLILDEIFDSSLDADGVDLMMKIINTLTKEANVIIISQNQFGLADKFEDVKYFEKVKNFSTVTSREIST
jgi:DNA repair exonuclease SbcCD ATPase subunit